MTSRWPSFGTRLLCSGSLLVLGLALSCAATSPSSNTDGLGGAAASSTGAGGFSLNGSGGGDGGPDIQATALVFDPPSITLTLDGTTPKTATYKLMATVSGTMQNVTAQSIDFDRPDIASTMNGASVVMTASGSVAGTGTIHAVYGGRDATATLIVTIAESQGQATIPPAALAALGKPNLGADPKLTAMLYPYDKTVFPLGINTPKMMWTLPNTTGDVYRLHLAESGYTFDLYQAVNTKGQLTIPQDAWDRVTASNTGDPLVLTLSRWDSAATTAYSSVTESFTVAPESLSGSIYYWTAYEDVATNTRVGSITRVSPGTGSTPLVLNGGKCMGCHSVSADGSTLVATIEDPSAPSIDPYKHNADGVRAWASFKLPDATQTLLTTKSGSNSALSPTGTWVVFGGQSNSPVPGSKFISLAVTATGNVIPTSGLDSVQVQGNDGLMMPAFSPDGTKLALVEAQGDLNDNVLPEPAVRILYLNFNTANAKADPTMATFDPTVHEIVNASAFPSGNNELGYPSFTPDGQYVAYHTGIFSTGCHPGGQAGDCDDTTPDNGDLWMSAIAGGTPIRLVNIDDPPNPADHFAHREPTFCPVPRGGYSWVVFTSMRDWGNEVTGPVINGKRRLWVAAIDLKIGAVDPSHPPFYVEAQDETTANVRGFWALSQCIATPKAGTTGTACTSGFQCCSGFCVDGQCFDKAKLSCVGVGTMCTTTADCCNAGSTICMNGTCQLSTLH